MGEAYTQLNLCLESLYEALSQKYDPLRDHPEITGLVEVIYQLLAVTKNNLIINISPSKLYCLHCYNEISLNESKSTIHLSCSLYHCFCSKHCFKRHALLCSDNKLIDLDYARCPICLTSIDISQIYDIFDENIPKIDEEYKQEQNPSFQCLICLTNYNVEDGITLDCDHRFCISCIRQNLEININSAQVSNQKLKCPLCPQPISVYTIEYLISPELFAKYEKFRLRNIEISENSNSFIFYCPGRDCEYICFIDNGVKEFVCPLCHFRCCPNCNKDIHNGYSCKEYAKLSHLNEEDKEFEVMVQVKGWLRCPVCGIIINKILGCRYIVCTSSKCQGRTYLCYDCGQKMEFVHQQHACKIREDLVDSIKEAIEHDDADIYGSGILQIRRNAQRPPNNPDLYIKPRKSIPWGGGPPQRKKIPKRAPHESLPLMVHGKKFA